MYEMTYQETNHYLSISTCYPDKEKGQIPNIEAQIWPFEYTWGCSGGWYFSLQTNVTYPIRFHTPTRKNGRIGETTHYWTLYRISVWEYHLQCKFLALLISPLPGQGSVSSDQDIAPDWRWSERLATYPIYCLIAQDGNLKDPSTHARHVNSLNPIRTAFGLYIRHLLHYSSVLCMDQYFTELRTHAPWW